MADRRFGLIPPYPGRKHGNISGRKRAVLAAGATERPIAFGNNDRPGVMLAGSVRTYVNRFGATPGQQVGIFTNNDDGWRTAADLAAKGVTFTYVTLHVGAGTFLPVKVEDIRSHKMHSEWGSVSRQAAEEIAATQAAGGRIIPVGTTALRLLETAARRSGQIEAWMGETDIFIFPGFQFNVASALMTNFHLPKSTLLMLVSALIGLEQMKSIYSHAIKQKYRFFSYGDSSLLVPQR